MFSDFKNFPTKIFIPTSGLIFIPTSDMVSSNIKLQLSMQSYFNLFGKKQESILRSMNIYKPAIVNIIRIMILIWKFTFKQKIIWLYVNELFLSYMLMLMVLHNIMSLWALVYYEQFIMSIKMYCWRFTIFI